MPQVRLPEKSITLLTYAVSSSDADADVLADYVLALLRHDGDIDTVRALCEQEIPDFLQEGAPIQPRQSSITLMISRRR